jgi:hypothetical protein
MKPDTDSWIEHMLTDESWLQWRTEHMDETRDLIVERAKRRLIAIQA